MTDTQPVRAGAAPAERRSPQSTALAESTTRWMAELPQRLQPQETAARFPRVANRLAALWSLPEQCRQCFDELLLDGRGDRQGFPERVAMELAALKNHYETAVFPTHQTVWDEIISRLRA